MVREKCPLVIYLVFRKGADSIYYTFGTIWRRSYETRSQGYWAPHYGAGGPMRMVRDSVGGIGQKGRSIKEIER